MIHESDSCALQNTRIMCYSISLLHNMDDTKIFDLASECYKLFREAFPEDTLPPNAEIPLYYALIHCRSRFDTWAGYTNALENGEDSLDKQLEFSPADDSQIVVSMLELIRTSLRKGKTSHCITD